MTISILMAISINGCLQGDKSEKPPVHLNPNMDTQNKYKPYKESKFFTDKSAMRAPVEGTVAIGELYEDTEYFFGMDNAGQFVSANPIMLSPDLLMKGEKNYQIFCTPCHNSTGDGMGKMINYVYPPATSLHSKRARTMPEGQLFSVISNGNILMPSYKHQIPVEDRWAIVSYIRKLQNAGE